MERELINSMSGRLQSALMRVWDVCENGVEQCEATLPLSRQLCRQTHHLTPDESCFTGYCQSIHLQM
jgi:hypothetical protein